jgi:hypothetical protein
MKKLLLTSALLLSAGSAWADNGQLKGSYLGTGIFSCMAKVSDTSSVWGHVTIQSKLSFDGRGNGSISGTFANFTPAQGDVKPLSAHGTFAYDFTYAPTEDGTFKAELKPGTYKGTVDNGPRAGQHFVISNHHINYRVSKDGSMGTMAIFPPEAETITYSDEKHTAVDRECDFSGTMIKAD